MKNLNINKISSNILKLTLIVTCFTFLFVISVDQSSAATIDVGPTQIYTTINSGIAASNAGDTIVVHHNPSNYSEQVVVNKARLNITASNGEDVTVQTTGSSTGFSVNSVNNVTISGFRVQGNDHTQGTGISLSNANYCTIINNVINSYWKGVSVTGSNNNISNNNINDTTMGASLAYPSNNNTISYNNVTNPSYNPDTEVRLGLREDGTYFGSWTPNQFNKYLNNIISNVNEGIFIQQGTNFNISGNIITIKNTFNYPWAITLSVGNTANQVDILSNNSISSEGPTSNGRGIYLISNPSSPANAIMQIFSNNITNFGDGIYSILYTPTGTSSTQLYLNRFYNNTHGLSIASSTEFTAINNWWGKNIRPTVYTSSPPAIYDIFDDQGTVTYDPWIVLNINANPSSISTGSSSTITADLTKNSNNQDTSILYPGQYLPGGIPVNFSSDSLGNVNPTTTFTTNGLATTTFNSGNLPGNSVVSTTVDAQTLSGIINIIGTPVSTAITVNPISGVNGKVVNLIATLNDLTNLPINNKLITFSVNNNIVGSAFTNALGVATLPYIITQNSGIYTILATFAGDSTYMASSNTNNLNVVVPPTASANPTGGLYNTNKVVSLSMSAPGTIYYTINGTNPTTTSTKYSGPITISSTTTLKFLAVDTIGNKSPIYTQIYTIDKVAPKVSSTSPTNNAIGVSLTSPITIKFSENIVAGANYSKIYIKNMTTGLIVNITKSISGNTLTIQMTKSRLHGNTYQVYIPAGAIKDKAGNNLATTYTFKFKTV